MPHLSSSQAAQFLTMPFRRHKQRYVINPPDEVHNVVYLGNVLTILAKGDQSIERPLTAIWRSYTTRKRDVPMKLSVTRSGLKVETKQLGVTEYWAHRITYCYAPPDYPRVFCWVYKHEGKRMKPELRCHAVLCKKHSEPAQIVATLTSYLQAALQEYKREKLTMEKARKNSVTSGGCPRRKLILQTGTLNFRPPVNRSKSAPRLGSIDEEDEIDAVVEDETTNGEDAGEGTSMSDFEYDESYDLDSLNYRQTPMLGEIHQYPTITTTFSLTDDQISQASTSSASTCASSLARPQPTLTTSKSFEGQMLSGYSMEEETNDPEEELTKPRNNFPRRQLSLSSANRKRLQPRGLIDKTASLEVNEKLDKMDDQNSDILHEITKVSDSDILHEIIEAQALEANPDSLTALVQHLDSALIIEEDELVAESTNSCASSDDGFGSSCHDTDSNHNCRHKMPKMSSQTTESDFLSDDSANECDNQSLRAKAMVAEPEAAQIRRILMANQQVTAL